ncbi:MAG: hypothetical protein KGS47_16885, partial [Chloroflexi bacterium]|nr:hypothetical protein [Chloroflexota bacterium]
MNVEHLWYTFSQHGFGASRGWRVRAASAGYQDAAAYRRVADLVQYELPQQWVATRDDATCAPVTLALLATADGARFLVRRRYLGRTWDGRPGNTGSHLVGPLPASVSARDAIGTWNAAWWRQGDSDLAASTLLLPPLTLPLAPGRLASAETLDERLAPVVAALIAAWLEREHAAAGRIALLGRPDDIATVLWAACNALPPAAVARMTFSTYERGIDAPGRPLVCGVYRDSSPPELRCVPPQPADAAAIGRRATTAAYVNHVMPLLRDIKTTRRVVDGLPSAAAGDVSTAVSDWVARLADRARLLEDPDAERLPAGMSVARVLQLALHDATIRTRAMRECANVLLQAMRYAMARAANEAGIAALVPLHDGFATWQALVSAVDAGAVEPAVAALAQLIGAGALQQDTTLVAQVAADVVRGTQWPAAFGADAAQAQVVLR